MKNILKGILYISGVMSAVPPFEVCLRRSPLVRPISSIKLRGVQNTVNLDDASVEFSKNGKYFYYYNNDTINIHSASDASFMSQFKDSFHIYGT